MNGHAPGTKPVEEGAEVIGKVAMDTKSKSGEFLSKDGIFPW